MRRGLSYGWIVIACAVFFQAVVVGTTLYGTPFMLRQWAGTFQVTRSEVILVSVLWQVGMGLMAPFVGRYLDLVPIRRLVMIGLALFVAGLLLASRAKALWHVAASYATLMAAGSMLSGQMAAQVLAAKWFAQGRGLALGIASLGTSLGGLVIPQILARLVSEHGWRAGFGYLAAGAALLVMPVAWIVLAREPQQERSSVVAPGTTGPTPPTVWTTSKILRSRRFWIPVSSITLLLVACFGVLGHLPAHAQDRGFAMAHAATALSLLSLAMAVGKILMGSLADRFDHRHLYWVACAFAIAGLPALASAKSLVQLLVGGATIGLAAGAAVTLLPATLATNFGSASIGRAMGIAYVVITTSSVGPLVAGVVFDRTGSYSSAFLGFAVALALAMALMSLHRVAPERVGEPAST